MKIGVFTPTYNRPDLARFVALQMQNQTVKPALMCFHQNGTSDSYEWAIADLRLDFDVKWIHTPDRIPQAQWYMIPLQYCIDQQCDCFFWCDHDDWYLSNHVEQQVNQLKGQCADFVINDKCRCVALAEPYRDVQETLFTAHAPKGMSSSMCFNRPFAAALVDAFKAPGDRFPYADQVVASLKPRFKCITGAVNTTTYVIHANSLTSKGWL